MQPSVAVLGAGAMGEAILRGLLAAGWTPEEVRAADVRRERADEMHRLLGIRTSTDPAAMVPGADVVAVVVKPDQVVALIEQIAGVIGPDQVLLSVAAGVPIATYESRLESIPVVRAMPNTPALLGEGAAAISAGTHATEAHMTRARAVLGAVGVVVDVPEPQIDAVTAVSGSGPAYVFLLAEAMQAAARRHGLSDDVARTLVDQTIRGAGRMLTETDTDAATLRERVTSPGGTTAAALGVFEAGGFRDLVAEAIAAAESRSHELGRES